MNLLAALLGLALLAVAMSPARGDDTVSVDIVEYGLYSADGTIVGMSGGIAHNKVANLCHLATTERVPARFGTHFGFRFLVRGLPQRTAVKLWKTLRLPRLVKPPGRSMAFAVDGYGINVPAGVPTYTGFSFGSRWQLEPGPWVFELSYNDRKLAAQKFEVVDPTDEDDKLRHGKSDCFPISSFLGERRPWTST